mmetsp:Transcript_11685/g.20797  ORF Transcript_11685/g.20797 Transcript_11685/m.20797 type:complete len:700 (+) Transcript_11685:46-2145(+)
MDAHMHINQADSLQDFSDSEEGEGSRTGAQGDLDSSSDTASHTSHENYSLIGNNLNHGQAMDGESGETDSGDERLSTLGSDGERSEASAGRVSSADYTREYVGSLHQSQMPPEFTNQVHVSRPLRQPRISTSSLAAFSRPPAMRKASLRSKDLKAGGLYYDQLQKVFEGLVCAPGSSCKWHDSLDPEYVTVSPDGLTVTYIGSGSGLGDRERLFHGRAIGQIPLNVPRCTPCYFEVKISCPQDVPCGIRVGLVSMLDGVSPQAETGGGPIENTENSFGIAGAVGALPTSSLLPPVPCEFENGDVVGCGIDVAEKCVYYTKNGELLQTSCRFTRLVESMLPSRTKPCHLLYPAVSLHNAGEQVTANFGPEFRYASPSSLSFSALEEEKGESTLPASKQNALVSALVREYMAFYGYAETLSVLESELEEGGGALSAFSGVGMDVDMDLNRDKDMEMDMGVENSALGDSFLKRSKGGLVSESPDHSCSASSQPDVATNGATSSMEDEQHRALASVFSEWYLAASRQECGSAVCGRASGTVEKSSDQCSQGAYIGLRSRLRALIIRDEPLEALELVEKQFGKEKATLLKHRGRGVCSALRELHFVHLCRKGDFEAAISYGRAYLDRDTALKLIPLVAYQDYEASPYAELFSVEHRESVADLVNATLILMGGSTPDLTKSSTLPRAALDTVLACLAINKVALGM